MILLQQPIIRLPIYSRCSIRRNSVRNVGVWQREINSRLQVQGYGKNHRAKKDIWRQILSPNAVSRALILGERCRDFA